MTGPSHYHVFETAHGFCAIGWTAKGVARFRLPDTSADAVDAAMRRHNPKADGDAVPTLEIRDVIAAAKRYFNGEKIDFSHVRLDLSAQENFFATIYAATRRLGWGQTTSYGALAKAIGAPPQTARDVGQAMAKNPIPLIIPCHRVLAAGGKVGGFSAPGGADAKLRMLEMEGVRVAGTEQGSLGL